MPTNHPNKIRYAILFCFLLPVLAISWKTANISGYSLLAALSDTIPAKKHPPVKNKKIHVEQDPEIKYWGMDETLDQINGEIEKSLSNLGMDSIQAAWNDSGLWPNIILPEINPLIEESLEGMNLQLPELDILDEMQHSLDNLDLILPEESIVPLEEIENLQDNMPDFVGRWENNDDDLWDEDAASMQEAGRELEKNMQRLEKSLAPMEEGSWNNFDFIEGFDQMLDDMEKDGLLNKEKDYRIEFNNEGLFINGRKQGSEVIDKYRNYFGKGKTTIAHQKGRFNINID